MDTKVGELISAVESFWNGWVTARKEKNEILIVCVSTTYPSANKESFGNIQAVITADKLFD